MQRDKVNIDVEFNVLHKLRLSEDHAELNFLRVESPLKKSSHSFLRRETVDRLFALAHLVAVTFFESQSRPS